MKILLTGSEGFIGTHFKEKSGFENIDCWDIKLDKDIAEIDKKDLEGVYAVVHLAGFISSQESWAIPVDYFQNNTINTLHLITQSVKAGVEKFIFASSAAAFGNPMTPYGASKRSAEHILDCYKGVIQVVPLRIFNVYGKGQNPAYAGVITKFIERTKKDEPVTIFGDGNQTRDYIYVDDVVEIMKNLILSQDRRNFGVMLQAGTGKETSVNGLIDVLGKITGKKVKRKLEPARREIRNSVAFAESIEDILGRDFTKLEDGLKNLI